MGGKLGPSPKVYCISLGGFVGRVPVPGRCLCFRIVRKVSPATVCMSMLAPHAKKKIMWLFFFVFPKKRTRARPRKFRAFGPSIF